MLLFSCHLFFITSFYYAVSRVGFFPSKTSFFRTKWKKLDKTCFVQFLPSKTVQNRPKLDEIMDILVKMVISLNYISTGQGLSTKPLLIIILLKYPIAYPTAQTLIAQAMGHFVLLKCLHQINTVDKFNSLPWGCHTAPSHNLNHCWLEILGIHPRPISNKICKKKLHKLTSENLFFLQIFRQTFKDQWVNSDIVLLFGFLLILSCVLLFRHVLLFGHVGTPE